MHPLIREFYEHTSRFKLSIIPEWRRWMKPGYELFKLAVAQPLGQAAIPSNIEAAQRGTDLEFPGHYLSSVDSERDALTVLKLLYFQEQIFVSVADGELRADHSFYLAGQRFLTLHYEIERLAEVRSRCADSSWQA